MRPIFLFKGFTDEQLLLLAQDFTIEQHTAGSVIFRQGDRGDAFYIIAKGEVRATRKTRDREFNLGLLKVGDFFGERAMLKRSARSATVVAVTDCELLRLDAERFEQDLHVVPGLRANLELMSEGRDRARAMKLTWLTPGEQIYAAARRHPIILYQALVFPAFVLLLSLAAGAALGYYLNDVVWGAALAAIGVLVSAAWMWWLALDWGNDYFIVTDQRIVYLEKIIGIYDSRQESPLASVLSVDVRITDAITRSIGIGDVIVRTYSGPISFTSVGNAQGLAALVEEQWNRSRARGRLAEREAIKAAIRKSINPPPDGPAKPKSAKNTHGPGLLEQLAEFFLSQSACLCFLADFVHHPREGIPRASDLLQAQAEEEVYLASFVRCGGFVGARQLGIDSDCNLLHFHSISKTCASTSRRAAVASSGGAVVWATDICGELYSGSVAGKGR